MKENIFGNIDKSKNLTEISAIQKSRNILITKREDIRELVEEPLIKACEIFWDKNIKTYESSANVKDIKEKVCYISLDYGSLSEENRKIISEYGKPFDDTGKLVIRIYIPVNEKTTKNEIEKESVEIANKFQKQAPIWMNFYTLEDRLNYTEAHLGEKYPEAVAREKERLTQPGAWEEECKRLGYYFDPETQTGWDSEESFQKAKEYIEYE